MAQIYDTIIIGGGAGGLSAAIYAGRYLLKTLVLAGSHPGGETATAWIIENYPGFKSIDGFQLIQNMTEQAQGLNIDLVYEKAITASEDGHCFSINTEKNAYLGKTLILALGSQRRHLGLPGEAELVGKGISYCSTCDAPLYKGKDIVIVGGGDSSVKGALLAAKYCRKIYLVAKSDKLTAEPLNMAAFKKLPKDKVEVILNNELVEFGLTEGTLAKVSLKRTSQGRGELLVSGVLVEIGFEPNQEIAKMLGVKLDERNYVAVDNLMRTSVDGIYACGDNTNIFGGFKQVITAAATGAVAATTAYQDLGVHGGAACRIHALTPAPITPSIYKKIWLRLSGLMR